MLLYMEDVREEGSLFVVIDKKCSHVVKLPVAT